MTFKHSELCIIAVNWLKRPNSRKGPGCQVAFSESRRGYLNGEIPDAIGFRAGVSDEGSILVECKLSRSDFLADVKKAHRIDPGTGMGMYRYFMAPQGLLKPSELPERWGLVEVTPKGVPVVVAGHVLEKRFIFDNGAWITPEDRWCHEHNIEAERSLLTRLLYRVGDVDQLQRSLKEANNRASSYGNHLQQLQQDHKRLETAAYVVINQLPDDQREVFYSLLRGEVAPWSVKAIPRDKKKRELVASATSSDSELHL